MSESNYIKIWSIILGIFAIVNIIVGSEFIFKKYYFTGIISLCFAILSSILLIQINKINFKLPYAAKSPFSIIGGGFIIIDLVFRGIDMLKMYDIIDKKYHIAMFDSNIFIIGVIFICMGIFIKRED